MALIDLEWEREQERFLRLQKWQAEREMRAFDEMNGESRTYLNWVVDPDTGITAEAVKVKHWYMRRNRPHLTVDGVLKLAMKGKINLRKR